MAFPGFVHGLIGFTAAIAAFFLQVLAIPFVLLGYLGFVVQSLPFLLIGLSFTAVMIPWVNYHDIIIEEAEFGMRTKVYPVYRDIVRDFINLLRRIYNPLICWWNALTWWFFGLFREAIFPTLVECSPTPMLRNLGRFFYAVTDDLVAGYFVAGRWIQGEPLDFTNICDRYIEFFTEWIRVYTCACNDMGSILRNIPILPMWLPSLVFSEQWADRQTWCVLSNAFNSVAVTAGELLNLVYNIFQAIFYPPGPQPFPRPDFRDTATFLCDAISCLVRSYENAFQRFWDAYIPFQFVFENWLCILDTAACIVIKTAALLLRILIHIDEVVFYPVNPFWEEVIRPDVVEILNLWAPPTAYTPVKVPSPPSPTLYVIDNYYLATNTTTRPDGSPNPIFGKKRLNECIRIFVERTICDPTNQDTACFSQAAQDLLAGLDFACVFDALLTLLVDLLAGLYEFTLHLARGPDDFFLFVDEQPYTTVVKDDVVRVADCLLQIFTLIPEVGTCLKDLVVGLVRYILCVADFLWRVITGLATLPFFLIRLPTTPNFLSRTNEALDFFVQINNDLIADTPTSVLNCLSLLLNKGFPVPPIPCTSCKVGGFVENARYHYDDGEGGDVPITIREEEEDDDEWSPHTIPPPSAFRETTTSPRRIRRMYNPMTGEFYSPWEIARDAWGKDWRTMDASWRVTPLIRYDNHTTNFIELGKRVWVNMREIGTDSLPMFDVDTINRFVDRKKVDLLRRWGAKQTCDSRRAEEPILRETQPHKWLYNKNQGYYDWDQCPSTWMPQAPSGGAHYDRLTTQPTVAPVTSCNPTPDCFDLACIVRALMEWFVHVLNFTARFYNGLAQGERSRYPNLPLTQDFPYFTGEFCDAGIDCFESDVVMFILKTVAPFKCACEFINLIIPVTAPGGRPDLCCAIQRVAELISCIFQVIVNAISALALGGNTSPPYAYYVNGMFIEDINALFDITLQVVECLCVFLRRIFPASFIPGFDEATDFDICCLPQAILTTFIETLRWFLQIIISLATITVTPSSYCYFRLDTTSGCGGTLDEIGFVKQWDTVFDSFFPVRNSACQQTCGKDQGSGGAIPCFCQLLNTLIPARNDPSRPVSCDPGDPNCPIIDFCCPLVKLGLAVNDLSKFTSRLLAGLWQTWDNGPGNPALPVFFVNYLFCDESGSSACATSVTTPPCNCGTYTCGKLDPFIKALVDPAEGLVARCTCELLQLLDFLLGEFFGLFNATWSNCFCGGNPLGIGSGQGLNAPFGLLPTTSNLLQSVVLVVVDLIRKAPLVCYWRPTANILAVEDTWIFNFLGPIADSSCIAVGNLMCFVNSVFGLNPNCLISGQLFLGSSVRWVFEGVFRVIGFIEGFIRQFTDEPLTCVGGTCSSAPGAALNGQLQADPLASILTAVLSFPVDLLIGDSTVACSTICPRELDSIDPFGPMGNLRCRCWDRSPNYPGSEQDPRYVVAVGMGCTGNGQSSPCCMLTGSIPGGVPPYMPLCESPRGPLNEEASCATRVACRPDSLPSCASHPRTPEQYRAYFGRVVDGILMGLIRYMSCVLGADGLGLIFKPLIVLFSVIWQILGGVIRFIAALVIFLLSLFTFFSGCECHDTFSMERNGIVRHVQIGALCYPCTNVNVTCDGSPPNCAMGCPSNSGSLAACLESGISEQDCLGQSSATNPESPGADPSSSLPAACIETSRTNACWSPNCQVGGSNRWPNCGEGDSLYPSNPLPLCSVLLTIDRFFNVIGSFIAIFTQPIMIPETRDLTERPIGPVRREGYQEFRKRMDSHYSVRDEESGYMLGRDPNIFDGLAAALFDYDTSDCYSDPVACACRNLPLGEHCEYTAERGLLWKRTPMTTTEMTTMVSNQFNGTSVCDHCMSRCGGMDWDSIPMEEKDRWVDCLDKRSQGERLHVISPKIPTNIMYEHRAPHTMLTNIAESYRIAAAEASMSHESRHRFYASAFRKHWPAFEMDLAKRAEFARSHLQYSKKMDPNSAVFNAVVEADQIWFKWYNGYYNYLIDKMARRIREGAITMPSQAEALENLRSSIVDIGRIAYHQPYRKIIDHSVEAVRYTYSFAGRVWSRGIANSYRDWQTERADTPHARHGRAQRDELRAKYDGIFRRSPIYKWWTAPPSSTTNATIFTPFREHIGRVIHFQRKHWEHMSFSAWNADLHFRNIGQKLTKHWTSPEWTPTILENWESAQRVGVRIYDAIYPGEIPKHVHDRFIINCNCTIVDRILSVTLNSIDYCLNGFMPNLNFTRMAAASRDSNNNNLIRLEHYLHRTSTHREGGFYHWSNKHRFYIQNNTAKDPDAWNRPRIITTTTSGGSHRRIPLDRRVYARQTMLDNAGDGPAGFNLISWFVCRMEELFDTAFSQTLDQWFQDVRVWFENTSTDVRDYPNVGALYWLTFPLRCEFPENLNCSIGIGLEETLRYVVIVYAIAILLTLIFAPTSILNFLVVSAFLLFVVIIPAVAWHYSPQCWFMTPSWPLTTGINIPVWPIPVAPPALPECFFDEWVALLDKYITDCYSPLVIPTYLVNGELCPSETTERIDVVNCRDVGVSDGLQHLLYLGYWVIGDPFCDFAFWFTATCLGGFYPGVEDYVRVTLEAFKSAGPTQQDRLRFCFYATIPTILLPLVIFALVFILIGMLIPLIFNIVIAAVGIFSTSAGYSSLFSEDSEEWYTLPPDTAPIVEDEEYEMGPDIQMLEARARQQEQQQVAVVRRRRPKTMMPTFSMDGWSIDKFIFGTGKKKKE